MIQMDLNPYTVSPLGIGHVALLQHLYERCSDFHELQEGVPTGAGAGERILVALPERKHTNDKLVLGIQAPDGELLGVLDLIRDYPSVSEWWLGLLMLAPCARGAGLGTRLYKALADGIVRSGGKTVYLGVLEHNSGAERFWRCQGFAELRRQPYTSTCGRRSRVIVMRHCVA